MPNSLNTFRPRLFAKNVLITNVSTVAITETSHVLQQNLNELVIRSRNMINLRLAFASGETINNYVTLKPGAVLSLGGLDLASTTIYIRSDSDDTVEILELYS
jgi:hypothetical protein